MHLLSWKGKPVRKTPDVSVFKEGVGSLRIGGGKFAISPPVLNKIESRVEPQSNLERMEYHAHKATGKHGRTTRQRRNTGTIEKNRNDLHTGEYNNAKRKTKVF